MTNAPSVLVFDVNETLTDIESLTPMFERIFGNRRAMREWFGQALTYSMAVTMSGNYVNFSTLGQGALRMLASIHHVNVSDDDERELNESLLTMPPHPEVAAGLEALRDNGFRLVTLSNSPPNPDGANSVENAGLADYFEQQLSVDARRAFKPATTVYRYACEQLLVAPADCMMFAAHAWDTMGAQASGFSGALITRPGNAALSVPGLPQPTIVATDLRDLAAKLTDQAT